MCRGLGAIFAFLCFHNYILVHLRGVRQHFYPTLVYIEFVNTFAKNLELLMKENAVSQKQLAQIINVRQQTVSRYVKGAREPDIDILIEIAKFFNVTVGQLVGSEEGI